MVYSFYKERHGVNLLAGFMKLCGMNPLIFSGDLNDTKRKKMLDVFNSKENIEGLYNKVILVTEAGIQGITLLEVRHVHITEPDMNETNIKQAVGRAVRYKSHHRLPLDKRTVTIHRYFSTLGGDKLNVKVKMKKNPKKDEPLEEIHLDEDKSSDLILFERGIRKLKGIEYIESLMKRSAFDCPEEYSYHQDCYLGEVDRGQLVEEERDENIDIDAEIARAMDEIGL